MTQTEASSDYERGFVDGMQKQMQSSVDKAVNRMAQPEQEFAACPECKRLEDELEHAKIKSAAWKSAYEVERGYNEQDTTPPQRKPLPKGEWPKHPSGYVGDVYKGYDKSDLDNYAMQVLAAHGIKE